MKKASALVLICVAAAMVGLPPVFGAITESLFQRRIGEINDYGVWSLDTIAFERRWFSSTAMVDVSLSRGGIEQLELVTGVDDLAAALLTLLEEPLTVRVDLDHGPVVVSGGPYIGLARVAARPDSALSGTAALEEALGIPYLFDFRGRAGLFGGLRFDADVPAIDYDDGINEFVLSGMRSNGRLDGDELTARVEIDSVAWSNPSTAVTVDSIRFSGDNRILTRYLWLGTFELLIGRAEVAGQTPGGEPRFVAENIAISGDSDQIANGSLTSGSVTHAVDTVRFGAWSSFSNAQIVVALDRLDAEALNDFLEATALLQEQADRSVDALPVLMPSIRRLLAAEPTLSLDPISFSVGDEPYRASVHVRTRAAAPADTATDAAAATVSPLDGVAIVTDVVATRPLVHRIAAEIVNLQSAGGAGGVSPGGVDAMTEAAAQMMVGAVVAQGFLVEDGDSYRATLEFENGEFSLNGTAMPFLSFR